MQNSILIFLLSFIWKTTIAYSNLDIKILLSIEVEIQTSTKLYLKIEKEDSIIGLFLVDNANKVENKINLFSQKTGLYKLTILAKKANKVILKEQQLIQTNQLSKTLEIEITWGLSKTNLEYLKKFKIKKIIYPPPSLKLQRLHDSRKGSLPEYEIINMHNEEYYGQGINRLFYGNLFISIKNNPKIKWHSIAKASFCFSSPAGQKLKVGEKIYSSIPSYSIGGEYKLRLESVHKYTVRIGIEPPKNGILLQKTESAITDKSITEIIELEDIFTVKE